MLIIFHGKALHYSKLYGSVSRILAQIIATVLRSGQEEN
jgi:hypothetical protein